MATFELSSNPAEPNGSGGFITKLSFNRADEPVPRERCEAASAAEVLAALDAYKSKVAATGKQAAISIRLLSGQRAPSGFRQLQASGKASFIPVNIEGMT